MYSQPDEPKRLPQRFVALENGDTRLCFVLQEEEGGYLYHFERRQAGAWQVISLPNRLISGPSFDLVPTQVTLQRDTLFFSGQGLATDRQGAPLSYPFEGKVTLSPSEGWFRFSVQVDLDAPLSLQHQGEIEPQIVVWLGDLHGFQDRQYLEWHQWQIANPTPSAQGVRGNDLPGLYYYDPMHKTAWILYFDMEEMRWFTHRNMARFLSYECAARMVFSGQDRYGIGLWANDYLGSDFPKGKQRFQWYLRCDEQQQTPAAAQAISTLMEALVPFLPTTTPWPVQEISWHQVAEGAKRELVDENLAFASVGEGAGYLAYVPESSQWFATEAHLELVTQADLLWPWLLWQRDFGSQTLQERIAVLQRQLHAFFRPSERFISNDFPVPTGPETVDSWYFFENGLVKWGWIALLSNDATLVNDFLLAFDRATVLAEKVHYLFPMFYEATQQEPLYGYNFANNGLYAYAALLAYQLTQQERYLREAYTALEVLCNLPIDLVHHEPQELAFGAAAAAWLTAIVGDPVALQWANQIFDTQMRMAYWYRDPSRRSHGVNVQGMFQACASVLYPALKESVEAILPWIHLIDAGIVPPLMLRVLNLQRKNDLYFFKLDDTHARYIPYENLAMLEFEGQTGEIGKEVYGAGEVFWLALLFEQYAQSEDTECMLLCLDLLDPHASVNGPGYRFLLWNPLETARTTQLHFHRGLQIPLTVVVSGQENDRVATQLSPGEPLTVTLAAGEWVRLFLSEAA